MQKLRNKKKKKLKVAYTYNYRTGIYISTITTTVISSSIVSVLKSD